MGNCRLRLCVCGAAGCIHDATVAWPLTLVFVLTTLQAVRLESGWSERVRYMVVIYTSGHQDTEENIVLGMDFTDKDRSVSDFIGLLLDRILFTYFCHTFVIDGVIDDCACLEFNLSDSRFVSVVTCCFGFTFTD